MNIVSSSGSQLQPYFEIVAEALQTAFASTGSFFSQIAQKVHTIWEAALPYIEKYVAFSQTKMGLATNLLGFSIIFLSQRNANSQFGTIASVAIGVLMLSGSALLFLGLV